MPFHTSTAPNALRGGSHRPAQENLMSSIRSLIKPIAVCGVVASLALLAGCGKSDGGGAPASTTNYSGSGGETYGYWVMVITDSTGVYKDRHLAPKGVSVGTEMYQSGSNIELYEYVTYEDTNYITLYPDSVNRNYQGACNYYGDYAFSNVYFYENWTVTPTADGLTFSVTAHTYDYDTDTTDEHAGTITGMFKPVVGYVEAPSAFGYNDYFSKSTKSDDPIHSSEGGVYEEYDWNPGTEVYYYWDAAYEWDEYLYIDQMYRDGNTLKGGGWYDGSFYDDFYNEYGTIEVQLDANGHPLSSTAKIYTGYGDNEKMSTISHPHYQSAESLSFRYDQSGTYRNLTVTALSPLDGEIATYVNSGLAVGDVITSATRQGVGYFGFYFSPIGGLDSPTSVSANQATWTVWAPREYTYYAPDTSGYDLDGEYGTIELDIVTVNYDATTHIPTGGVWTLEVYSPSFALQRTETMTFTIP